MACASRISGVSTPLMMRELGPDERVAFSAESTRALSTLMAEKDRDTWPRNHLSILKGLVEHFDDYGEKVLFFDYPGAGQCSFFSPDSEGKNVDRRQIAYAHQLTNNLDCTDIKQSLGILFLDFVDDCDLHGNFVRDWPQFAANYDGEGSLDVLGVSYGGPRTEDVWSVKASLVNSGFETFLSSVILGDTAFDEASARWGAAINVALDQISESTDIEYGTYSGESVPGSDDWQLTISAFLAEAQFTTISKGSAGRILDTGYTYTLFSPQTGVPMGGVLPVLAYDADDWVAFVSENGGGHPATHLVYWNPEEVNAAEFAEAVLNRPGLDLSANVLQMNYSAVRAFADDEVVWVRSRPSRVDAFMARHGINVSDLDENVRRYVFGE